MTSSKIKKEIIKRLYENEVVANRIQILGYDKENNRVKKIIISLDDIDTGSNVLYQVKEVLDQIDEEFNISFIGRFIDF